MVIEVFKTNVLNRDYASFLLRILGHVFTHYEANFDLDDCDRILRVKCSTDSIDTNGIIQLLRDFHVHAEILEDELAGAIDSPDQTFASGFLKNIFNKN
jgi:hypothetical protein